MRKLSQLEESASQVQWAPLSEMLTYAFTNKSGKMDTIRIEFSHDAYGHKSGKSSMSVYYNDKRISELDDNDVDKEAGIESVRKYAQSSI